MFGEHEQLEPRQQDQHGSDIEQPAHPGQQRLHCRFHGAGRSVVAHLVIALGRPERPSALRGRHVPAGW
jgi:hypothetical protein